MAMDDTVHGASEISAAMRRMLYGYTAFPRWSSNSSSVHHVLHTLLSKEGTAEEEKNCFLRLVHESFAIVWCSCVVDAAILLLVALSTNF
jgi:hypothetical protein